MSFGNFWTLFSTRPHEDMFFVWVYSMSASTDANRDNSAAAIHARMAKYERTTSKDIVEIEQLPRWAKTALVMRAVDGLSYNEAAERVGKSGASLERYARSPAADKWLAGLAPFLDDPIAMAKAYLSANALSITLERLAFLEAAVAAGDYREGDKIARDLQDRVGIIAKRAEAGGAINIRLSLGGALLEGPVVEAEWSEDDVVETE